MASARAAGGLHTLRHIEAGLQAQLSDHRADLQSYVQESARGSEESALRRAEALLGPPVESVKERLDREVPVLQRALEAASAEARHEIRALREELAAETAHLRGELCRLGEQLPPLSERVRSGEEAIASFQGVQRDLWTASESLHAKIAGAAAALRAEIYPIAEEAAMAAEKRWGGPLQERIGAVEASVRATDERARHDSAAAMDAAKMVQDALHCRADELRLHASQEAQRRAAETAAGLREEVLEGELLQRFGQRLQESVACMEARLFDCRAKLTDAVEAATSKAQFNTDALEARLSEVAAQVAEALEATRRTLASQEKIQTEAVQECSRQLRDLRSSTDAADALVRQALEGLRGRMGRMADDAAELREGLGQARRAAHDDVAAVRGELRERALQWRAFDEVGMPTLLAHVEQRAGEAEGRSVRAALDYAERLRRLPPPAPAAPPPPSTTAAQGPAHAGHSSRFADMGAGDSLTSIATSLPLPPLTPASVRRLKGY